MIRLSKNSLVILILLVSSWGCGYHLSGKAVAIPETIDSIAVPTFVNKSVKYRLEQRLTAAVVDELVARTKYRITSDPAIIIVRCGPGRNCDRSMTRIPSSFISQNSVYAQLLDYRQRAPDSRSVNPR